MYSRSMQFRSIMTKAGNLEAYIHYRIQGLCRVSAKPRLHSAKILPSVTLGKGYSAKISSAKTSLPSAKKHLAKRSTRQNVNRKKIQKMKQKKKFIRGGMHSQLVTHLMGCTFFSAIFHKLSMIGFVLTTSCTQTTLSTTAP
jgi:hypothetical protein